MTRRPAALAYAVAAALVVAATAHAPPARAHGETSPLVRAVIDRVSPPLPKGVTVRTEGGGNTLLEVRNDSPTELEFVAPEGEPFLRIGPAGVLANANSVYWYASGNPDAVARVPPGTRRGGPPRWVRASAVPRWSWYEHRLHPEEVRIPPEALETRAPRRLFDFSVPMRVGGRPTEVAGYVEYRPVYGTPVPRLTVPPPASSGVFLTMVGGAVPGIFLVNRDSRPVIVTGSAGEPFARVGPRGAEVNVRSASYAADRRVRGSSPEAPTDPGAPPRWRKVEDEASLLWLETRARYPAGQPPDEVLARPEPTKLVDWVVPIRKGRDRFEVRGVTTWVPEPPPAARESETGIGTTVAAVIVGVLVAAAAVYGATRMRRRRAGSLAAG